MAYNIFVVMYKASHLSLQVGYCSDDENENWPLLFQIYASIL
jgi:hypothetical protein